MDEAVYRMIGLAMKAGRLLSGNEQVLEAVKEGRGEFLLIAKDSSERTKEEYITAAKKKNMPYALWGEKEKLGHAIGKGIRTALLITDSGLSQAIQGKMSGET